MEMLNFLQRFRVESAAILGLPIPYPFPIPLEPDDGSVFASNERFYLSRTSSSYATAFVRLSQVCNYEPDFEPTNPNKRRGLVLEGML